jgi:hypothetical protein
MMGTSLYLRDHHFPNAYAKIAAFFADCAEVTTEESMRIRMVIAAISRLE